MTEKSDEIELSVIVTVVSGKDALRDNLTVLSAQVNEINAELIVPYDNWSNDILDLAVEFPTVHFHLIADLGLAASSDVSAHQHRLYDRRRAAGLQLARGKVVAITEDHTVPSDDWCLQLMRLHKELPYEVIGGAIENGLDRLMNWAWYYCDFGRYGRPFSDGEAKYISDVNVSYKRRALVLVKDLYQEVYNETTIHWALRKRGAKLFLDERLVVFQMRPAMSIVEILRERIEWARIFAETRAERLNLFSRLIFAVGTFILPAVLLFRVFRHMTRQRRTVTQIACTSPYALFLLIGWSFGELIGYLAGSPLAKAKGARIEHSSGLIQN